MEFEWDSAKADANKRKHGVSFTLAVRIFADPDCIVDCDTRHAYGEERFIATGNIAGRLHVVVYTKRGDKTLRIISARKANKKEVSYYADRQTHG